MNGSLPCILVIDDDEVFRKRLARAFRIRGYEAGEAANGEDALKYLKDNNPERAVLDLKLGDESGLTILQALLKENPALRVVVLTGYGTISTTVEALKLGAINYLTKPLDADSILSAFSDTHSTEEAAINVPPLAQVEWDHIQRVLEDCGGNVTKASKALGIHRRSLQRKLAKNPHRIT